MSDTTDLARLDFTPQVRCDSASPQVACMSPAEYRLVMHPPKAPGATECGNHVSLLCRFCTDKVLMNIRRTFARARGPRPVCPVCGKPFREPHGIVKEVERL
ncbi:hypothetical protein [Gordonia soli]|uniref:Uncharacterized protein n=1 Tax=Gordonia soli NBRC 108243 TaxID=1223545 RepID=M0QRQ2_9ACTN|nr:hypothetical protein [Gordonia soli]GAC71066.1 hypothetical protein GS4_51_00040 [Gordonia soli NBRC 108243]